ncbi:MAG: cytidine deaminase [Bacteroidales bacterium]|nr:cytidine deaminase [Bacteroidales bacterium]HNW72226.1 cytidine deaminase [Bacteroidales bacterium]HPS49301.1 cytidine deaminase [Bacteroidales bacterium]
MKEHSSGFTYQEFDSPGSLSNTDRELIETAKRAAENSYAPYSKYHVGAALRLVNGMVITGSNQENASFPVGSCAERVALFAAMASYPDISIESIAITAHAEDFTVDSPVTPCGICRQAILEYELRSGRKIRIIMAGETGPVYIVGSISDLLPLSFSASELRK